MSSRSERLKAIYEESFCNSITQFAKEVNVPQKTMNNYLSGIYTPKNDALVKVIDRFPEFNLDWLLEGRGEKYNPKYVTINEPQFSNVATGNNEKLSQSVTTGDNTKYVQELENSRASILKLVLRKIGKALECPTKEESDARLKELEEDLKDMNI